MSLKNPLAYYTPGIPGRGAGTILKQPDLTGYAARQMKLTDLKLKQKQDEDKKVKDDIADLMNLKGTIDTEIREEGKNKVDYFFNEAQKEISKVNGNWGEADMSRLTRLKWETENYLAQGTIIGKEHDETSKKWVAMEASGLYDDDILAEQKQYIIDESKKPLMERNYPAILSISKLYDFDKKTTDKTKGVGVFQNGRISKPILDDETGLYVSTGTKVSGVSTPEVMEQIKSSMITDPKYAKNFAANFDKMKGQTVNYRYVNYNKTNGNVDIEQKQVTITTPEQYMEFEAGKRSYAKYTPVVKAQSKSGGGTTIVNQIGSNEQAAPDLYNIPYYVTNEEGDIVEKTWSVPVRSQRSIFAYNNERNRQNPLVQKIPGEAFSITGKKPNNNADWIVTLTNEPEPFVDNNGKLSAKETKNSKKFVQFTAIQKGNYNPETGQAIRQNEVDNWFIDPKTPAGIQFIKTNVKPEYWDELIGGSTPAPQQQNNNTGGSKFKGLPKNGKF